MFFFFKQKTAYEMRISDWSSDVCSSDLKTQRSSAFAFDDFISSDWSRACQRGRVLSTDWPMRGRQSCIAAGRGRRRIPPAGRVLLPETPPGFLPMSASQPLVQSPLSAPASALAVAVALAVLYVVWGSTYLGIRFALEGGWPPLLMAGIRSEEHTSELQSLMRISSAVFCLKNKKNKLTQNNT